MFAQVITLIKHIKIGLFTYFIFYQKPSFTSKKKMRNSKKNSYI